MEAKDTVLSDKETIEIIKQYRVVKLGQILPYHWHRETQAEISFKAGYDQAVADPVDQLKLMYKAGIREVVEFVETHKTVGNSMSAHFNKFCLLITDEEWKAKLKEWNI